MANKKILAGTILATLVITTAAYAANTNWNETLNTKQKTELTQEQKAEMQEMKTLFEKVKNWETLTTDEQAKLDTFKAQQPQRWEGKHGKWWDDRWKWPRWDEWFGWRWGFWGWFHNLTDEEKTQLESMTDEAKDDFFEAKRQEQEVKMLARETVIDKLLNNEVLTEADKVIVTEIKAERAEQKERKLQAEAIRTIFEKSKNWETLTSDEQAKLDEFKAQQPQKWFGKEMREKQTNTSTTEAE